MFLDEDGNHCAPTSAAYMLLHLTKDYQPTTGVIYPYVMPLTNECVYVVSYQYRDIYAVYCDLSRVTALMPTTMAIVGGGLSGNFRAGLCSINHTDYYAHNFTVPKAKVGLDSLIGAIMGLPTSKISLDHHLFIRERELRSMITQLHDDKNHRLDAIAFLVRVGGRVGLDNKVSMITFVTYCIVAPLFAVNFLIELVSLCNSKAQLIALLKLESQAAKQSQTVFRHDLSAIYELNALFNRLDGDVDWDAEREHRVHPDTVQISSATVYKLASDIFRDALNEGQRPFKIKWRDYWATRWSTLPGGSVISQYDEDIRLKKMLPTDAKVKSAWFAANNNADLSYWLNRQPDIFASTSTKYEWGKVRALYGADVTSFLHADFGMHMCEDTLPSYFPVGKRANETYIKEVIERFATGVPFCFDYDDFNSQHSNASMAAVVHAWLDAYRQYLTGEQIMSVEWTIESIANVSVRFNDIREVININGTLLSGWRLTSFINTVLNRVYLLWAGIKDKAIYSLHNGDDMYASTPTIKDALDVVSRAKELGIRAQVSKTNIGTIGEFLRVDTRAKDTTGRQYLARAVCTAVHGRIETGAPHDLRAVLLAFSTRAQAIALRGGDVDVAAALETTQRRFAAELFNVPIQVVTALETFHPIQGGMAESAWVKPNKVTQKPIDDPTELEHLFEPIRHGVMDYVEHVRGKLGIPREKVEYNKIYRNAVRSLVRSKISYEIVIDDDPDLLAYMGQWKSHSKSYWISSIAKARSMGFVAARQLIGVNGALANKIRCARDPLRYMGVIL